MVENKLKDRKKVREIGGKIERYYNLLTYELEDIDRNFLEPLRILGYANNLHQYLTAVDMPVGELEDKYKSRWVQRNGHKYNTHRNAMRAASVIWQEKVGKDRRFFDLHRIRTEGRKVFYKALYLDPEKGLGIDIDKFLEICKEKTKGENTEKGKLHTELVEKLNQFFTIPITEELIRKYFRIKENRIEKTIEGSTIEAYMGL